MISLLTIFLINQLFTLNLTGNRLQVILFWNVFSQLEKKTFIVFLNDSLFVSSNKSKEDWEALRGLADERDIVIKQAVKGLCGLVLCRDDYIKEDDKNLEEKVMYKDIKQFFRTW